MTTPAEAFDVTELSRIRRLHQRGTHKRKAIYAILDSAPLCHIVYVVDGQPIVTPTLHWREGDRLYRHGSAASRFLDRPDGAAVYLTCALMDGYVLARSIFNHSVNYRFAMVFGTARVISDDAEKLRVLRVFADGLFPGRWESLRPMTPQEFKATAVVWMDIVEASAKLRAAPEPAPDLMAGLEVPEAVAALAASSRLR